jgi:hypothetical protein
MMYVEKGRSQRLEREAKALNRKQKRHGGTLSSKEAARLTQVNGRIVKYNMRDDEDDDVYQD